MLIAYNLHLALLATVVVVQHAKVLSIETLASSSLGVLVELLARMGLKRGELVQPALRQRTAVGVAYSHVASKSTSSNAATQIAQVE